MIFFFLAFVFVALALFWWCPPRGAILFTVFGGWLLLPVGHYPALDPEGTFPWWITGLALPGDMLISKAPVAATVALLGGLLFNPGAARHLRLALADMPILLWCLWPLTGFWLQSEATPSPVAATAYLFGTWGALWVIGRIWFSDTDGHLMILRACAWAGVACLPFAIVEGVMGISLYASIYGPHPYWADGLDRYIGFRPVGFFEHGTQYGIWVAVSALAALWLVAASDRSARGAMVALLAALIALASQSIGAILFLCASLLLMMFWRIRVIWPLLVLTLSCAVLATALHLSGLVPLRWLAKETEIGQLIVSTFKSLGRGSFTWRFAQDLKAMALIDHSLLTGTMIWDWWRPAGIRPWGLWLLLIGQYGIVAFMLAYGALLGTFWRALQHMRGVSAWARTSASLPLALIVLMALADSMLNAFFYFPALLAAGALVARPRLTIDRSASDVTPRP